MRGVVMKTILAAAIAGASLLVATGANAHDRWDKWDRWERKHHKHHWKHSHGYDRPSRVIVERPVYVEPRPVYVAPMAPMVPAYGYGGGGYQQDPSVNFNFSFPR
ncbi:MAG TPA: hypothetical protein VFF19_25535 [Reyranella sp.]|jgi:hypothetical protein|nr:hypothetical protein [Reyranella sp.]